MMAMMERHTVLAEIFLAHQSAILERDFTRAAAELSRYGAALLAHIDEEEAAILPLYDARAPQPPGGQTRMFRDEHARLRTLVAGLVSALSGLGSAPSPAEVIAFLDEETLYRHYMDHHDRRERAFLYPGLDSVMAPEERRALLAKLTAPA